MSTAVGQPAAYGPTSDRTDPRPHEGVSGQSANLTVRFT
jgi:hypothetical protein